MSKQIEGGPVVGTGGGKFGPAMRWTRPERAAAGAVIWTTCIMVAGIGPARYGRRESGAIELTVGKVGEECRWRARSSGTPDVSGVAATIPEAQGAAVAAAKTMATALATRPRESSNHPPIGPAAWPAA